MQGKVHLHGGIISEHAITPASEVERRADAKVTAAADSILNHSCSSLPLPHLPGVPWTHRAIWMKHKTALRALGMRVQRRTKVANGCPSGLAGLWGKVRDGELRAQAATTVLTTKSKAGAVKPYLKTLSSP